VIVVVGRSAVCGQRGFWAWYGRQIGGGPALVPVRQQADHWLPLSAVSARRATTAGNPRWRWLGCLAVQVGDLGVGQVMVDGGVRHGLLGDMAGLGVAPAAGCVNR
jgi:hypothetical protein